MTLYNDVSIDTLYNRATGKPVILEKKAFTGTSAATTASLVADTTYMLQADQDCHIAFGASPTATTGSHLLIARTPYIFHNPLGNTDKIAVIRSTTNGNLYISTLNPDRI